MLNWMSAVSGAVSNLPSAPTKMVLGTGFSVGLCAIEGALRTRTTQGVRMAGFIGSLLDLDGPCFCMTRDTENEIKLPLYTSAGRTRPASRVAIERSKARKIAGQKSKVRETPRSACLSAKARQNKTRQMRTRHILAGGDPLD